LHYRLAGPQGTLINTFEDKPATLSLGSGELSPGMEEALLGLEEGVRTTFELAPGVAFGERNPDMQQWVSKSLLKEFGDPDEQYNVGDVVQFPAPTGQGSFAGAVQQSDGTDQQQGQDMELLHLHGRLHRPQRSWAQRFTHVGRVGRQQDGGRTHHTGNSKQGSASEFH
jgi:hypothetical protein